MLGKPSKRLAKKLEENGTRANATVVEIADKGMAITSGQDTIVSNTQVERKTRLKVTPENEPEFEVTQRFRFPQMEVPSAGDVVGVIYDPGDHDKLMLDHSRLAGQKATLAADGFDPSSISGEVDDLEMAELGMIEQGQTPAIRADPEVDSVAQLEKLTALKEKGALSDAEFETEKAKILGQ